MWLNYSIVLFCTNSVAVNSQVGFIAKVKILRGHYLPVAGDKRLLLKTTSLLSSLNPSSFVVHFVIHDVHFTTTGDVEQGFKNADCEAVTLLGIRNQEDQHMGANLGDSSQYLLISKGGASLSFSATNAIIHSELCQSDLLQ